MRRTELTREDDDECNNEKKNKANRTFAKTQSGCRHRYAIEHKPVKESDRIKPYLKTFSNGWKTLLHSNYSRRQRTYRYDEWPQRQLPGKFNPTLRIKRLFQKAG